MEFKSQNTPSEELVWTALTAYQFDSSSSIEERLAIRQMKHAKEHGEFSVTIRESDELICSFHIDGNEYTRKIPFGYEQVTSEVYPIGDVRFTDVELFAVSLVGGFPWTSECFVASYWGTPDRDTLPDDNNEKWFSDVRLLRQYFPPRDVTSQPPPCTVRTGGDPSTNEFITPNITTAVSSREPNPWAYGAMMVLYENQDIAGKLIHHENPRGDPEKYDFTPPEKVNSLQEG